MNGPGSFSARYCIRLRHEDRQDGSPQNSHRFHRRNHRLALRSANGFAVERFDRKGTSILSVRLPLQSMLFLTNSAILAATASISIHLSGLRIILMNGSGTEPSTGVWSHTARTRWRKAHSSHSLRYPRESRWSLPEPSAAQTNRMPTDHAILPTQSPLPPRPRLAISARSSSSPGRCSPLSTRQNSYVEARSL